MGVLEGLNPDGEDNACQLHIGERLCKLEQLFEKFVCRKTPNATPKIASPSDSQRTAVSAQSNNNLFDFKGLPLLPSSDTQSLADGIVSARGQPSHPTY